jgi:uncharacterized membrane protein YfcA
MTLVNIGDFGLLAAAGLLVGAIVGLTGVGGGSIMTPLLITVFGVPACLEASSRAAFRCARCASCC